MFTYNTMKIPILLKDYGRYIQQAIQQIAQIPSKEDQTTHIENLIPILQNIRATKNKNHNDPAHLWSDAFIASNYKLNINAPYPLPSKEPIQKNVQKMQPNNSPNPFKGSGKNLVKLIHIVLKDIEKKPQAQDIIIALAKTIQQIHKKTKTNTNILTHIEQIAQKKIPIPHTEIEKHLTNKNNRQKKHRN